jgi:predicted PurR-regulated permease PerM
MTFIQFKPKINPFIKAAVFAGIAAFVLEPLAEWLKLYIMIAWKHIYSFPIFAAIYLAADWLAKRGRFYKVDS